MQAFDLGIKALLQSVCVGRPFVGFAFYCFAATKAYAMAFGNSRRVLYRC
jgi:hypothetical protein